MNYYELSASVQEDGFMSDLVLTQLNRSVSESLTAKH